MIPRRDTKIHTNTTNAVAFAIGLALREMDVFLLVRR
jgi:hypothetical protein